MVPLIAKAGSQKAHFIVDIYSHQVVQRYLLCNVIKQPRDTFESNLLQDEHLDFIAVFSRYQELTIDEIINGSSEKFTGLIPFIRDYMDNIEIDVDTRGTVKRYLDFISMRASGKLMTNAK